MSSPVSDFVGAGWNLPGEDGVALVSGMEKLDLSIRLILSTAPGERVMRPEFGCEVWDLLFAPLDANSLGIMATTVREALQRWEPRIEVEEVDVEADGGAGQVRVAIAYRVRATNDRRNLVWPFYVIPHQEPSA